MVESLNALRSELEQLDKPSSPANRFETLFQQTRTNFWSQEERRQKLLREARDRKRDDVLMQKYAETFAAQFESPEKDADIKPEFQGENENKDDVPDDDIEQSPRRKAARMTGEKGSRLMLSEWLLEVPSDFEENWIVVACPVGKRCSVVAAKGRTCVFGRTGMFLMEGRSSLPGNTGWKSKSGPTVLDCIYDEKMRTFFVLDVLFWNGSVMMDHPAEFRFFWLESRLQEQESCILTSGEDEYSLSLLDRHPCSPTDLQETVRSSPQFTSAVDGFMFFHKDGLYLPGTTPLVCWLKPFMIPEVLRLPVPNDFMTDMPRDYISIREYVDKLESQRRSRRKASMSPG